MLLPYIQPGDITHCAEALVLCKWNTEVASSVLSKKWLDIYSSSDFAFNSVDVALKEPCPLLSQVRCYKGRQFAESFLVTVFTEFVTSYSVGKGATSKQIKDSAAAIYKRYYFYSLSEIKFILSRAKRTKKVYDAIDGNFIERLFDEYDQERTVLTNMQFNSDHAYNKDEPQWLINLKENISKRKAIQGAEAQLRMSEVQTAEELQRSIDSIHNLEPISQQELERRAAEIRLSQIDNHE